MHSIKKQYDHATKTESVYAEMFAFSTRAPGLFLRLRIKRYQTKERDIQISDKEREYKGKQPPSDLNTIPSKWKRNVEYNGVCLRIEKKIKWPSFQKEHEIPILRKR